MRNRAAPIGISGSVSTASSEYVGLGCSLPTIPNLSRCHAGICRAFACSSMGVVVGVNGLSGNGPFFRTTLKERAGFFSFNTSP